MFWQFSSSFVSRTKWIHNSHRLLAHVLIEKKISAGQMIAGSNYESPGYIWLEKMYKVKYKGRQLGQIGLCVLSWISEKGPNFSILLYVYIFIPEYRNNMCNKIGQIIFSLPIQIFRKGLTYMQGRVRLTSDLTTYQIIVFPPRQDCAFIDKTFFFGFDPLSQVVCP